MVFLKSVKPLEKKIFVIDTNVLMHDPMAIYRFDEHDIYIPIAVLEELDKANKGLSEVARNVRQVSLYLDELIAKANSDLSQGLALPAIGDLPAGRLYFHMEAVRTSMPNGINPDNPDNILLGVTHDLDKQHPNNEVILVSKDINLRIKAHALGIKAEDYSSDQVIDDADLLYAGSVVLDVEFWNTHSKDMDSWTEGGRTYYRLSGPAMEQWAPNQFLFSDTGSPFNAIVREINEKGAIVERVLDYSQKKNNVWGITARNTEQSFALNLLMDPDVDFVSLLGQAGTGKTLLTLAAALTQTLDDKLYSDIIVTRMTVPVGEDIGFLPGTEEEKMEPWMGALEDNIEVLQGQSSEEGAWGKAATQSLLRNRIHVKSLNFMRGRTFQKKFLIIDEAQNLSPHQLKTLITRAGPGSKVVCLGNIAQIDTPYLTETTSGLTYVVDRFRGWQHSGHITLQRGERSRLADQANAVL
ncbi:MAG: PhoH family protein [Gammaproteobacteria bacterium]|nr:MAG: PhoH family protein [Gammaproteobacteria bacterium]